MKKIFRILKNALCILISALFAVVAIMTVFGAKGYSVASQGLQAELKPSVAAARIKLLIRAEKCCL